MRPISAFFAIASVLFTLHCYAADIDVIGVFPGKAVLVVDGGAPKTYSVGQSISGPIKLIEVGRNTITINDGVRQKTLQLGEHFNRATPAATGTVTLAADSRGHYMTEGQINGGSVRMLVDTGATLIALPAVDASRLGINYKQGQLGVSSTANGMKQVYKVTLDTVRIGDIQLNQVDATVHEDGLPMILLGMSFLNRMEMRRDGTNLVLSKRY